MGTLAEGKLLRIKGGFGGLGILGIVWIKLNQVVMDDYNKHKKKTRVNVWLVIGVLILIALLIIWLTIADLWGDTDVAAQATGAVPAICNYFLT